jgi:hypothetical protein
MVRTQRLDGIKKSSKKTTYAKSYHSHQPRAVGGPFFLPRTPQISGGGPRLLALLVAGAGSVVSAPSVVVTPLGAVLSVAAEESAASGKAAALPPASSPAAGTAAEVVELCPACPPPPSSGAWGPAPR